MSAKQRLDVVLAELGIEVAKKSLGQNFLISDFVIDKIVKAADDFTYEQLLEIGPGAGALTNGLRAKGKPMRAIELDRKFAEHWRNQGLEIIEADALRVPWHEWDLSKTLLVSNLPYQISSSLVIDRSLDEKSLVGMVLMFQKEVAQRIRANFSTEHYGLLSVIAQNFWEVSLVSDVGPGDFWPPPKIASRVLKFIPKIETQLNRKKFLSFVKQGFSQRRKVLRKNLSSILNEEQLTKLQTWIEAQGLNPQARAEELTPAQWRELFLHI